MGLMMILQVRDSIDSQKSAESKNNKKPDDKNNLMEELTIIKDLLLHTIY